MKWLLVLTTLTLFNPAWAEDRNYPSIYPYVAPSTEAIDQAVVKFTEDENYTRSLFEMMTSKLVNGRSDAQPWSSYYWQIANGLIADDYQRGFTNLRLVTGSIWWNKRVKRFKRRFRKKLSRAHSLSQRQLDKLAPSEKYDLALGDTSFDLTHRLWDYSKKWGEAEEYSFITKALIPENYVLANKSRAIALWEGICHGWAASASVVSRPKRTVELKMPNGKYLRFFPEDVKALVSLTWANSEIQDGLFKTNQGEVKGGSIFGGLMGQRCWTDEPARDEWGRYYDPKPYVSQGKYESDDPDAKYESRCIGVHPAVFHLGLVNVMGVQGNSFVADVDAHGSVNNHPVSSYHFEYFNPQTGRSGTNLNMIMVPVKNYGNDPFKDFRNPEAKYIVGVQVRMEYVQWMFPKKDERDSASEDKIENKSFMYDLELDGEGNVIGGQWRLTKTGAYSSDKVNWPDFIWKITKDWKKEFKGRAGIAPWTDKSKLPPRSWKTATNDTINEYHRYTYLTMGRNGQRCKVVHQTTGETKEVPCDIRYERPQPLVNFVNDLVDLASQ